MRYLALVWASTLWKLANAKFILYAERELGPWAQEKGVSTACITSLNKTLDCADGFLEDVITLEDWEWTASELSETCTSSCQSDVNQWVTDVKTACAGSQITFLGNYVVPWSIPLLYQHKLQLGCMQGGSSGWCWVDNQDWEGSDWIRYDEDMCDTGDPEYDNPLCFEEGFDQFAIEPEDKRLANIYERSMVCSECYLKILHHHLQSPVLEKSEYTDYLIEQFSDLESFCTTSMPLTTSTASLFLSTVSIPTLPPTTATQTDTAAPAASTTCSGQLIQPSDEPTRCDELSLKYNVTTGDLLVLTNNWDCDLSKRNIPICAPKPCELRFLDYEAIWTCEKARAFISTDEFNVTEVEFSTWNKRIDGLCDQIKSGQYICARAPGGVYEYPLQVHAPTSASYYSTATPVLPTPTGTTENCGKYHDVKAGDSCYTIVLQETITLNDFLELNSGVWDNCTNLFIDFSYCVAPVLDPPVSTNGKCGPDNGHAICAGSGHGNCCSYSGQCGSGLDSCGAGKCYSGECLDPNDVVSENGSCGPDNNNWICAGEAVWGKCCSIYGWCGNTNQHCGAGLCYNGQCDPDDGGPSSDGSCGPSFPGNRVCEGTQFGSCCSVNGFCGDGPEFCGSGNCHSGACT